MTKDSNKLKALQALNAAIAKLGEHDVKAVIEASKAYYQSGYRDGYAEATQALAAVLHEAVAGFTAEVNKWLYQHGEDV